MPKIKINLSSVIDAWEKEMLLVINRVDRKIKGGDDGMGSPDGANVEAYVGKKILVEFKQEGYRMHKQQHRQQDFWVVESKKNPKGSVTIDFGQDTRKGVGWCTIRIFEED